MNNLNRRFFQIAILIVVTAFLVACSEGATSEPAVEEVTSQVAFIYPEASDEYNWSRLHEIGRQYLDEQLPDLGTKAIESVSVDDAEDALRQLAEEGHKLIFATAAEYSDAVLKVAGDFPDTFFEIYGGSETADNVATYDGRMYQAFYVAGGYTGEMTVSGVIGLIAPEPTIEVIRHINAITAASLLVRTCEDIAVHVRWTGSWNDPEAERAAALELVDLGADVLVQHTYSPEAQKVAEEKGVRSMGYGFDMREFAPKANMTSIIWQWGWYYLRQVEKMLEDKWKAKAYDGKVSTKAHGRGIVDMAPYNYDQIPHIMEAPPLKWRITWNETVKDSFDGPVYAQNGDLVLAKGDKFPKGYIFEDMDWFVEGVVGDAPGEAPEMVEGRGRDVVCR